MDHDDDIGAGGEGEAIAGLLVPAITAVHGMDFQLRLLEGARDGDGFIMAGIIHDDDEIDDPMRHDFVIGLAQCARGIVGGHHHNNLLAVQHYNSFS